MKVSFKHIRRLSHRYGEWVLITGATSGIGRELALKFAEAGFKLILTGRREKELRELSTALFDQYATESIPIPGDLSQSDQITALLKDVQHLDIGIAVLNAGYGTSGLFTDADLEEETNMLDLNGKAVLVMAHQLTNKMRAQPKKGALVFMSSIVAFQGVPHAAHYAATKAYVHALGEALAIELKRDGIDVLLAVPGPVASGFETRAHMRMNKTLRPEDVGVPIIEAIGRRSVVVPGWLSKVLVYSLSTAPRWARVRIMGMIMGGFTRHQT